MQTIKKLNEIIKESIKRALKKHHVNKYECLNEARSSIDGMRKNTICSHLKFSKPCNENTILNEGVDFEIEEEEKGGTIVLSTDVNAVKKSENVLINYITQKISTIINRLNATRKIDKVANKHALIGWTIGHCFVGRYKAKNGKNYGEKSLTVDVVGVSDETMIHIAEDICRSFSQESILLKLNSGRILFIDPN